MSATNAHPRRVMLYSHDAMGIGHLRRNLRIAQALGEASPTASLLVAGVAEACAFELPPGVDCLTLPALRKADNGAYAPRRLPIPQSELIALRASTIRAAVESFHPDVLIVDKLPRGAGDELTPALELMRSRRAICVLGLRDVLDEPQAVKREWSAARFDEAIERFYEAVWIYGDARVLDSVEEYSLSSAVAAKVRYTGYVAPASGGANDTLDFPAGDFALCVVGGGEDGGALAQAFAEAELPAGMSGVVVTGPFMSSATRAKLRELTKDSRHRIVEFMTQPQSLLARATRVVTMGGYNAVCEGLSVRVPMLVVPRVRPRAEQLVRAERLKAMGLIDMLHPSDLTPVAIGGWLAQPIRAQANSTSLDLSGAQSIPKLLEQLLTSRTAARREGAVHA